MKKVMALLLMIGMVTSLIPVTFAADTGEATTGVKIEYEIGDYMSYKGDTSALFSSLTYEKTNGFWEYADNSTGLDYVGDVVNYAPGQGFRLKKQKAWFAMKIQIPVSGTYGAEVKHVKFNSGVSAGRGRAVILPASTDLGNYDVGVWDNIEDYLHCEVDCRNGGSSNTWTDASGNDIKQVDYNTVHYDAGVYYDAGEYYLVYYYLEDGSDFALGDFTLYTVDAAGEKYETYNSAYMGIASFADKEEDGKLTVDETTNVSAVLRNSISHEEITSFTYTSSDETVATVAADGTVTAVAPGIATISATAAGYAGGNVIGVDVTVSAPTTNNNVSFSVAPSESAASVTVEGITYGETVKSVARGTEVTLTANTLENYTFIGWKRGSNSADNSYISTENPFTTTLYTNTYLTAVYAADTAEEEAVVEYYNQNGDYIDTLAPTVASPTPGAIPGFTFTAGNWLIGENTKLNLANVTKRTRAVAKHTAKENAGTVTVGETDSDKTAFDSAITPVATEGFTCWKRDGKVVSYNQDYTYYLWDNTTIEQSNEALPAGKKLPIIILDNDKVDDAYMIEYDAADYEIVEVGLVFGDSGTPSVDSCAKKFTSQRKLSHGQMAAKYSDNVRGYLIYKDGNDYRVIYDGIDVQ